MLSLTCPPSDTGVLEGAPETPGCVSHARRWVLAGTILGSSVAFIEASVINVALPEIQRGLDASVGEMQWIASCYTLFLAALTLASGSAGDRFGRRLLFMLGLAGLALSSGAAALAATAGQLIAARAAQGIGGALLVPNSLSLLSSAFPRAERGRAIGTWSAATALTSAGGPILGGFLVDTAGWRSVFVLVVPLALVTLALTLLRVPEVRIGKHRPAVDWPGAVLATLALGALVFGIITMPGGSRALAFLGVGIVFLVAFAWHELRTPSPMTPPHLFRSRTFVGANLLTLLLYFALTGVFFVLPFVLVRVHGYSATATGAVYLPFALLVGGLSRSAGGLADRFGPRLPLVAGPLVTAGGFLLFSAPRLGAAYWSGFFPCMVLVGLGMAITVAPLTSTVMAAVDESETGIASGVNNTVARVATLLAVAIVGLVALEVFGHALGERLATAELSQPVRAALTLDLGVVHLPDVATATERALVEHAAAAALVTSFQWVAVLCAVLAIVGALAAGLLVQATPSRAPAAGDAALVSCGHLELVLDVGPRTQGCEECLRIGARWVHLRMCLTCGHVGCCDSSRHRHATAHFWASGHPIVRSSEPGETWRWCYVDDIAV